MTGTQLWTVGEVAELTRVSVRTLHHYDALGLLMPSVRSEANYRLYAPDDLSRLWRILTFRELGFPLSEIGRLLGGGPEAELSALRLQAALLQEQASRAQRRLGTVMSLLEAAERDKGGFTMSSQDLRDMFDGFDPAQYESEVQERWGDTDACRQTDERTRNYTRADWAQLKEEGEKLTSAYLTLMDRGFLPEGVQAQQVAAHPRAYFQRWFYNASPDMMRSLALMWIQDERFTHNIDRARPGLAAYQSSAVTAWAGSQVGKSE
ncbi:hypothetical protein GCM10008955_01830 [Deinococcus malanensis]|uniref:HTH merR-type domain-containing protein n=1 Tax=Deinococcus malanensis TaxID=1706855 RepID=A0ABQ2EK03_9DEIO|nr:MerR family transcriptional regulator [Deinococcus malanensis]GGK12224.1 hypothetical protein GCM10008955_01830 [Deinococcus malanensis]